MATLRDIRNRISGVKKTQKITKAMKMVAAAKMRRAQTNMLAARPYAQKMKTLLQHLSRNPEALQNPFIAPRETKNVAIVVVTSDRGLCGAFNSNLLKAAFGHIASKHEAANKEGRLKVFCVGKKGFDLFTKKQFKLAGKYVGIYNDLNFGQAQTVAREIIERYRQGEFDLVEVVYNEFKSVAQQRIVIEQFLPVVGEVVEVNGQSPIDYIYEPTDVELIESLLPKHLNFQIWRVLLESNAAEQGARMSAMENATTNANEMISTLQLAYNKARQATITSELLEIVGGAEALKKAG